MNIAQTDDAVTSRFSCRAFLRERAVPRETVERLLRAGRAPQGLKVYVLQGRSRDELVRKVCAAHDALYADPALAADYREEYAYYPEQWFSPYIDRRRENGWGLYGLLGIGKGEKDKMHAQHQRNFRFFDAPLGLMFTVPRERIGRDVIAAGMYLQSIMVAARAEGLHTCPQAAWNGFARIVLPHVGAGEGEMLVCGMSVGHADPQAKVNTFHTPREPAAAFTRWLD